MQGLPNYKARVERGIVITIQAIEWNCPQHITPRCSEAEVDNALKPLLEENRQLRELLTTLQENHRFGAPTMKRTNRLT